MEIDINTKMVTLPGTPLEQSFAARIRLWTGWEAPIETMRRELQAILGERKYRRAI